MYGKVRMPIYEYQCDKCGHKFEEMQRMSDDKLTVCPECGEAALRKLISAAAFRLKGEGWYETDFKDSGKNKEKKEDAKTTDGKKTEGGEGKSDAKGKSDTKTSKSSDSKSSSSSSTKSSSGKND